MKKIIIAMILIGLVIAITGCQTAETGSPAATTAQSAVSHVTAQDDADVGFELVEDDAVNIGELI